MIFIIGLGNPGEKYQGTRHNVGQLVIAVLAQKLSTQGRPALGWKIQKNLKSQIAKNSDLVLVKSETYMNESGLVVRAVLDFYSDKNIDYKKLFAIHDDLDLELGNYKIQFGKGPKVHNGLNSIYQHLGTDQFWHVRVGIDGRAGDRSIPPDKYVLGKFKPEEQVIINRVVKEIVEDLSEKF